ncbi:hypothetical protein C8035_v012155 [Colletotrichum spinosum]|uniref:Extracellular membrane protein CFEM domain-containing protein n=1 Tax=Colletotrichum spinosum TaxID=1347390 RepID=A0A4R8Q5A6_9PEZI|nr:hypothetical protein C8035_v012155 [Colletotrichum spinosum]
MSVVLLLVLSSVMSVVSSQELASVSATSPAPSTSACYARCYGNFLASTSTSCKTDCVCAGSKLLADVECCMTTCTADEIVLITESVKEACVDGPALVFDSACARGPPAAPATSEAARVVSLQQDGDDASATAGGGRGAGGIGGGIGTDGNQGGGSHAVGLGVGLGVGIPAAALVLAGCFFLWRRGKRRAAAAAARGDAEDGLSRHELGDTQSIRGDHKELSAEEITRKVSELPDGMAVYASQISESSGGDGRRV